MSFEEWLRKRWYIPMVLSPGRLERQFFLIEH